MRDDISKCFPTTSHHFRSSVTFENAAALPASDTLASSINFRNPSFPYPLHASQLAIVEKNAFSFSPRFLFYFPLGRELDNFESSPFNSPLIDDKRNFYENTIHLFVNGLFVARFRVHTSLCVPMRFFFPAQPVKG